MIFDVRIPDNVTTMSLMIRLSGKATVSWWVTGVRYVLLDTAMRNIVRTNATDFEIRDSKSGKLFTLGREYTVRGTLMCN